MPFDLDAALAAACKSGALVRHTVRLEQGEMPNRRLWMRQELAGLPSKLDAQQAQIVLAALRRFVLGGPFTVVTAECPRHWEVHKIGDLRELKGPAPPFIELRFKPPRHDLRLFGRFVGKDDLVLTTYGMKSPGKARTGEKRLSIPDERKRCDMVFKGLGLPMDCVPETIQSSITRARFL